MKFTRGKRIALELLGPGVIAGIVANIIFGVALCWRIPIGGLPSDLPLLTALAGPFLIIAAALMVAVIPSIICTVIIEKRFARGLDPQSWQTVKLSTLLGWASGIIFLFGDIDWLFDSRVWLLHSGMGLLVGFILGLLIRRFSSSSTTGEEAKGE